MTTQEAYNMGLDFAENQAITKLTEALNGEDHGLFANPKMEELKRKILILSKTQPNEKENIPSIPKFKVEYLLNGTLFDVDENEDEVIRALHQLMSFIYDKASKGNNGARNYIKMIEDIRSTLTNQQIEL